MINLYVVGRSHNWFESGQPLHYIGAVTECPDKSDRSNDIVQTLPTTSPGEALMDARYLRGLILQQSAEF